MRSEERRFEGLEREATILSRYLLGSDTTAEVRARYAAGVRRLFETEAASQDGVLDFVLRHPSCLPFLDAAEGLLAPHSELRRRLLLMLACLETTREHADFFLSPPRSRLRTLVRLASWGTLAVAKLAVGLALRPLARRGRGSQA